MHRLSPTCTEKDLNRYYKKRITNSLRLRILYQHMVLHIFLFENYLHVTAHMYDPVHVLPLHQISPPEYCTHKYIHPIPFDPWIITNLRPEKSGQVTNNLFCSLPSISPERRTRKGLL